MTTTGDGQRLGPAHLAGIGLALACGALVRVVLLPTEGVHRDMDAFALWTHHAATTPLGEAYRTDISFPVVMAWLFWRFGALGRATLRSDRRAVRTPRPRRSGTGRRTGSSACSAGRDLGVECGRELRSKRPSSPSSRHRRSH